MNEQDILTHDTENRHYKITWTGDINNWAKVFDEKCSFVGTIKSTKTTEAILYNNKEKGEKGYSPYEQKKCLKITDWIQRTSPTVNEISPSRVIISNSPNYYFHNNTIYCFTGKDGDIKQWSSGVEMSLTEFTQGWANSSYLKTTGSHYICKNSDGNVDVRNSAPLNYLDFSSVVDPWFDFTNYDYYLKFYYVGYSNRLSNYTFLYTNLEQMLTIDGTTKQCVFPGSCEYGFNGWEIVKISKEEAQSYKFNDKGIKSLIEDGLVSLTTDNTDTLINIKNKNDLFSKMTVPAFKVNNKYCYEGVTEKTVDNITDDEYFWIGKDNDSNEGYYNNKLTEEKGRELMGFLDKQYEVVYQPFETDGSPSELQTRARIKLDYDSNTKTLTISQYALKVYSDANCTNKVTNESLQSFNEDAATKSSVNLVSTSYTTMTKYKYSSSVGQYYSKFELHKQDTKQLEKPYIYLFGVEKTEPIEVDGKSSEIILQKSDTKYGCIDLSKNNSITFDFITIGKENGVFSGSTDNNYYPYQNTTRLYQKQINVPVYKAQSLSSKFFPYTTTTTLEWSQICNAIKNRNADLDQRSVINSITYYINTDFYSTNLKYYSINTDYGYSEDDTTYADTSKSLQIQKCGSNDKGYFSYHIDYSSFSAFSLENGIYYNMPGVGDIKYKYNTIQSRFSKYATDGIDFSWFLWWDVCSLVINKSIKPLYEEWIKSDYNLQSYIHYPLPAWPNLFLTSTNEYYHFDKALVNNGAYLHYNNSWTIAQCYGLLYGDNNEIFNNPVTYDGDFPVNSPVEVRNSLGARKLIRRNNVSIPNAKLSEYNDYNFITYPDRIYNADGVTPAAIIIFAQVSEKD